MTEKLPTPLLKHDMSRPVCEGGGAINKGCHAPRVKYAKLSFILKGMGDII
jgi:hypothetical protein